MRTPAKRADAMQRAAEGWQLRVMGKTWQQVADALDYASAQGAHRAVTRFAGTIADPEPGTLRKLWRARMEQLYAYAARDARKSKPGALRAGVAIAQRASALDGLDAPLRVETAVSTAELDQLVQTLVAAHAAQNGRELEGDVRDVDVLPGDVDDDAAES